MSISSSRLYFTLTMLSIFGLVFIWKGITGNVTLSQIGEPVVPRWQYIVFGLFILIFPIIFMLTISETI